MNLSDSEKRDIYNLIENGKNLPEKYKFILFDESKQVELNWNGKSDHISSVILPFQIIEQIDEPRSEKVEFEQGMFDLIQGRQQSGWSNKLIWGDNKYILSSLKNGPLREVIEKEGGIKLIYIDPPFDTAADFSINVGVGENNSYDKQPNVLEHIAYRDTWGRGDDSFLSMIYERLKLAKDLLSDDGSIYLHCDYRLAGKLRMLLDEVFGENSFTNEIIWQGTSGDTSSKNKRYIKSHDTIFYYRKDFNNYIWNDVFQPFAEGGIKVYKNEDEQGKYAWYDSGNPGKKGYIYDLGYGEKMPSNGYRMPKETALKWIEEGILKVETNRVPRVKRYMNKDGVRAKDVWSDIKSLQSNETLKYPTQKPEKLLERIIKASSNSNDIILDFFCGSGTVASVAEKLQRKWICADLGKFAIHTTRKRMIGVQRELKQKNMNWRSFEILNLGKYQREYFLNENNNATNELQFKKHKLKINDFENLIFEAYKSKRIKGFKTLHGIKGDNFISLGPVNQPLSRNHIEEVIDECVKNKIISVDILGFEYEMGLFPTIQEEAKSKGLRLKYKQIPIEIFDKRAVERGEVIFYDVAFIDFEYETKGNEISVKLTDFAVFYNEETFAIEDNLKPGRRKVVVDQGQIVEKVKTKEGAIKEETLTKTWHDWIDYWSVDFNYESKKELIQFLDKDGCLKEQWTGNYVFENEWQSFRTRSSNNKLELKTSPKTINSNKTKIAVKVIDIFGNDTMKVLEVNL